MHPTSSLLLPLALAAVGGVTAFPVSSSFVSLDPRIVGTISCTPYNFTASGETKASLFVNSTFATTQGMETNATALGFPKTEGGLTAVEDAAKAGKEEGKFGFEVCESGIMKSDSTSNSSALFGHATYTATNGSIYCLTVTYPYRGQTPKLEECSISDDSSQFLQWWHLTPPSDTSTATNDTQFPTLEFSGPSVIAGNPPLYPSSSDPTFTPVTLARKNETDAFFFLSAAAKEKKTGVALEKEPEKKEKSA